MFFHGVIEVVSAVKCKIIHHAHVPFDNIGVLIDVISVVKKERFLLWEDDVIIQEASSLWHPQLQTVKTLFSLLVNSKTPLRTSSGHVLVTKTSNIRRHS